MLGLQPFSGEGLPRTVARLAQKYYTRIKDFGTSRVRYRGERPTNEVLLGVASGAYHPECYKADRKSV